MVCNEDDMRYHAESKSGFHQRKIRVWYVQGVQTENLCKQSVKVRIFFTSLLMLSLMVCNEDDMRYRAESKSGLHQCKITVWYYVQDVLTEILCEHRLSNLIFFTILLMLSVMVCNEDNMWYRVVSKSGFHQRKFMVWYYVQGVLTEILCDHRVSIRIFITILLLFSVMVCNEDDMRYRAESKNGFHQRKIRVWCIHGVQLKFCVSTRCP